MEIKNPSDISSEDLAGLIVDALVDAGIISQSAFEDAVSITTEEIDARKYLRDYWCATCPDKDLTEHNERLPQQHSG